MENNRIDRMLLKETLAEIERTAARTLGVNDINPYRKAFEKEFCRMFGFDLGLAVNSGTDALQLALLACGIGPGDNVIIPDLTYIATGLVVKFVGAETTLADVEKGSLTIDPALIEKKISSSTKAIIAVHMFGHPCNMEELAKISKKYKLYLIEDACQALGSSFKGKYTGSFSDLCAFSFSYYKPLSSLMGNGGMVVGSEKILLNRIDNCLNTWRIDPVLDKLDRKFHRMSLTDIASVKIKLKYFKQIVKSKEISTRAYEDGLAGCKYICIFPDHKTDRSVRENFHIFAENRDGLLKYLLKKGIDAEAPYAPLHATELFKSKDKFPITEEYAKKGLHLPLYSLMKTEEVNFVVNCIRDFYS